MPDSPETGYAFWVDPDSSFKITYSLPVFHEIDFYVGEGFRRIPHGGVELGGLLFGRVGENSARIEAFRPIECEHASGPSFVLSERDLKKLEEQLAAAKSDPDLADLEPLGWFVAHTRSELKLNDREAALFDRFLPGAGKFTMLAKPERFQPTRFAFLVRTQDGRIERDGRDRAIILPLPGRASAAGSEPVPSIPAPPTSPAPEKVSPEPLAPERVARERVANRVSPERLSAERVSPERAAAEQARPMAPQAVRKEEFDEVGFPPPRRPAPAFPTTNRSREREVTPIPPLPPLPHRVPRAEPAIPPLRRVERESRLPAAARLLIAILIAAALGCGAGYWAYTQLPPATIPLSIEPRGGQLLVSWPKEQTQNSDYAAIRVDDGPPVALDAADKAAGQTTIKATGSEVKVELIVQHWMRESRGIVRFVAASAAPAS